MTDADENMEALAEQVSHEVENTLAETMLGKMKHLRKILKRQRDTAIMMTDDQATPLAGLLLPNAHANAQKTCRAKKHEEELKLKQENEVLKNENQALKDENQALKDEVLRLHRTLGVTAITSGMRAL